MGTTQRMARFITEAQVRRHPDTSREPGQVVSPGRRRLRDLRHHPPARQDHDERRGRAGWQARRESAGTQIQTNAVNAALANGTLGHSEDFDDYGPATRPCMLMPVVLAMGEELSPAASRRCSPTPSGSTSLSRDPEHGRRPLREGLAQHFQHRRAGVHRRGREMLNLDETQTRMALGIGATQASGLRANFGTMTKPFHPGNSCRAGVMAAKMAQKGYEANPDMMEHRFGYAAVYGEEMMHLSDIPRHLGNPWALMGTGREVANGISMKIWPCCGGTHGANTAMTHLFKKRPIKAEEVQSIDIVTTHEPSCMAPNLRWPKCGLQGKFSTWYTVASLIVDGGKLDLSSFTDEAAGRPAVQALLKKVNVTQDPDRRAGRIVPSAAVTTGISP